MYPIPLPQKNNKNQESLDVHFFCHTIKKFPPKQMPFTNSPSSWVSLSFCESTGPRSRLVHQALWIQSQELYHSPTSTLFLQAMGPVHYSLGMKKSNPTHAGDPCFHGKKKRSISVYSVSWILPLM